MDLPDVDQVPAVLCPKERQHPLPSFACTYPWTIIAITGSEKEIAMRIGQGNKLQQLSLILRNFSAWLSSVYLGSYRMKLGHGIHNLISANKHCFYPLIAFSEILLKSMAQTILTVFCNIVVRAISKAESQELMNRI